MVFCFESCLFCVIAFIDSSLFQLSVGHDNDMSVLFGRYLLWTGTSALVQPRGVQHGDVVRVEPVLSEREALGRDPHHPRLPQRVLRCGTASANRRLHQTRVELHPRQTSHQGHQGRHRICGEDDLHQRHGQMEAHVFRVLNKAAQCLEGQQVCFFFSSPWS